VLRGFFPRPFCVRLAFAFLRRQVFGLGPSVGFRLSASLLFRLAPDLFLSLPARLLRGCLPRPFCVRLALAFLRRQMFGLGPSVGFRLSAGLLFRLAPGLFLGLTLRLFLILLAGMVARWASD
jgi:accessory gene regulator protein AgrB